MTTLLANRCEPEEVIYPFDAASTYTRETGVPPLCASAFPHLVGGEADRLLEEIEGDVLALPPRPVAVQLDQVARIITRHVGGSGMVERSGGSCGYLSPWFHTGFLPQARLIHLHRNGLDTAVSMMNHSAMRMGIVRSLQIATFGEDFFAQEVGGFLCAFPKVPAMFIVGDAMVSPAVERELSALHPASFDPAALWRIRLPVEMFARMWSVLCVGAERLLRRWSAATGQDVVHLSYDRIVSGQGAAELEKLRAALGVDPERWDEAVSSIIRRRHDGPPQGSRIIQQLEKGSSALDAALP